jgi:CxxC motif-containing protein (DUF1111 family)
MGEWETRTQLRALALRMSSVAISLAFTVAFGGEDPPGREVRSERAEAHTPPAASQAAPATLELGRAIFKTEWISDRAVATEGRRGLGPLYNAAACDACHHDGARGKGPLGDGLAPVALEVQLAPRSPAPAEDGDPVYGRVLNTAGADGVKAEGVVLIHYSEQTGYYYPDGMRWRLRVPHYQLVGLNYGPLTATTVIKPRLAPPLFGVALLDDVPPAAILAAAGQRHSHGEHPSGEPAWQLRRAARVLGRIGWQGAALSTRDQSAKAFALEMGVTSSERPSDDCTASESDCLRQRSADIEVSDELLQAVVAYVRSLPVPASPVHPADRALGAELFATLGCRACHRPQLPVEVRAADGTVVHRVIAPYSDLLLHDLGNDMADEDVSGKKVPSRWRTAPLWGLGAYVTSEPHPTLLHDGRARTPEEAILWHGGEADSARRRWFNLGPRSRAALLEWLETL